MRIFSFFRPKKAEDPLQIVPEQKSLKIPRLALHTKKSRTSISIDNITPIVYIRKSFAAVAADEPKKLKTLVCDDSKICRKSVRKILLEAGHTVEEADDGVEALFYVQLTDHYDTPFDCLICDEDMPHMRGSEAVKLLRAKGFDQLVIIGLTGRLEENVLQSYRNAGCDMVVRKPLTAEYWKRIYDVLYPTSPRAG